MSFTIVTQLESTSGSFENRQLLVVYAMKVTYLWSIFIEYKRNSVHSYKPTRIPSFKR